MRCVDCPELWQGAAAKDAPPDWKPRALCCLERGRRERAEREAAAQALAAQIANQPSRQARRAMARAVRKGRHV